jgi:hypothetical protein
MNKGIMAFAVLVLIASIVVILVLGIHFAPEHHTNSSPTPNPSFSPNPTSQLASPSPSPTSSSTTNASFAEPLSYFAITSPANTTYSSNILTLNITGQVIRASNVELFMNYSIDGRESLPFPVIEQPRSPNDQYVGIITGTIALQKLSEGTHSITVFGNLKANDLNHLAQAKVYFKIDSNLIK